MKLTEDNNIFNSSTTAADDDDDVLPPMTQQYVYSLIEQQRRQPCKHESADDGDSDGSTSSLDDASLLSEVGGKALSLIRCSSAAAGGGGGFPIPPGFCLSVAFFEPWLTEIKATKEWETFVATCSNDSPTKGACDALKALCANLSFDDRQQAELESAIEANLGNDPNLLVAVRSSSPEEDLAQASFAGGYETTLGVTRDNLLEAIRTSFASALDFRVIQYKLQNGLDIKTPRIAVIVQKQLDSDVSGVGFSLNPQNNCYDEAVISCNFGLGETVVAGIVTPDTFVIDKVTGEIISKSVSEKTHALVLKTKGGGMRESRNADPMASSLTDEQIREVASLIVRVEHYMEKPVDIEWAFEKDKLYLLQARPITVYLPLFPEMITAPGERKNLYTDLIVQTQGFSDSMSVLGMDVWIETLQRGKPFLTHGEDGVFWEIHGRQYVHVSNLLGTWGGETLVTKFFEMWEGPTGRILDVIDFNEYKPDHVAEKNKWMMWARLKQLVRVLPSIIYSLWDPEHAMDSYVEQVDITMKRYGKGGSEEKRKMSATFAEDVDTSLDTISELLPKIGGMLVSFWSKWRLHRMFAGDTKVQDLLITLNMDLDGNPTSEMGHAMLELASFPEIQETRTGEEFVRRLQNKEYCGKFLDAYNDFMFKYGCRTFKEIDIATPRTYEDPSALFERIKLIDVGNNQILTTKHRKEEAYQTLLKYAAQVGKEKQFKHHASVIQKVGGYREHGKYMYVFLVAYVRRRALALGEKWAKEGRLEHAEDVFSLHLDEIAEAEQNPQLDLGPLIAKNMAPYEAVANVAEWPTVFNSRGKIIRAPREDVADGLGGDPISPGTVQGRAKVLHDPFEKPIESGEVLVARATEPSWTPIFINAAGVVLEVGGPLQHGAIIAREYGIPCVSGVERATSKIKDGDVVEVDGTNGVVRLLSDCDEHQ